MPRVTCSISRAHVVSWKLAKNDVCDCSTVLALSPTYLGLIPSTSVKTLRISTKTFAQPRILREGQTAFEQKKKNVAIHILKHGNLHN